MKGQLSVGVLTLSEQRAALLVLPVYPREHDKGAEDLLTGVHKKGLCFRILDLFGVLAFYFDRIGGPEKCLAKLPRCELRVVLRDTRNMSHKGRW